MKAEDDRTLYTRRSFGASVYYVKQLQQDADENAWLRRDKRRAGLRCRFAARRMVMFKLLITSFFMVVSVAPALAKSIDVYPVSCNELWAAVHDTLDNQRNYGVISVDDTRQRARFVVVGSLGHYTQKVELKARDGGCLANATVLELGSGNGDWLQFQHRIARSLEKLRAAKPKLPVTATGQQ
jgi:hypothetical protein